MKNNIASVQYNDFRGTAAADRSFEKSLTDHLKGQKLLVDNDLIVGTKFFDLDSDSGNDGKAIVYVYKINITGYKNIDEYLKNEEVPKIDTVELGLNRGEFFNLFERFEIVLISSGFEGLDIELPQK